MFFIEKAFGLQAFYGLFEGELEVADACWDEGFDDELVFSMRDVHLDETGGEDGQAVFGFEFEFCDGAFPYNAWEDRDFVFE